MKYAQQFNFSYLIFMIFVQGKFWLYEKAATFCFLGVKLLRDIIRNSAKKTQEYVRLFLLSENLNKTEVNQFVMSYFRQPSPDTERLLFMLLYKSTTETTVRISGLAVKTDFRLLIQKTPFPWNAYDV